MRLKEAWAVIICWGVVFVLAVIATSLSKILQKGKIMSRLENDKFKEYVLERVKDLLDEHAQKVYDHHHVIKERNGDTEKITSEYALKIIHIVNHIG